MISMSRDSCVCVYVCVFLLSLRFPVLVQLSAAFGVQACFIALHTHALHYRRCVVPICLVSSPSSTCAAWKRRYIRYRQIQSRQNTCLSVCLSCWFHRSIHCSVSMVWYGMVWYGMPIALFLCTAPSGTHRNLSLLYSQSISGTALHCVAESSRNILSSRVDCIQFIQYWRCIHTDRYIKTPRTLRYVHRDTIRYRRQYHHCYHLPPTNTHTVDWPSQIPRKSWKEGWIK
jgi:hypothetical protein